MVHLIFQKKALNTCVCPNCNADWGGDEIFDVLRKQDWCKDKSDDKLREHIRQSYSPPYRFERVIGVEYPYDDWRHKDGIVAWMCPDCKHMFPRDLGAQSLSEKDLA